MVVLITGCGRHSKELIDNLRDNENKENVFVIGTNNNEANMLKSGLDKSFIVPDITLPNYIDSLLYICDQHNVDVVFPFITAELLLISKNKHRFEGIGTKVAISDSESIKITNDKINLSRLYSHYMPIQEIAKNKKDLISFADKVGYPKNDFCSKLNGKAGGNGFCVISEEKGLDLDIFNKVGFHRYATLFSITEIMIKKPKELILQEKIEGTDYSVVVLCNHGEVIHCYGYLGYEMNFGAVVNGETHKNEKAYEIVKEVCKDLKIHANACFDFMVKENGDVVLLEINPRINATIALIAKAGINIVYDTCKLLLENKIPEKKHFTYNLKIRKHYESDYYV